ncbi:MAG: hypothetical protein WAT14_00055, partial [Chitinophagaceae bacterium]
NYVPQNTFAEFWNVEANQLENISMPVSFISNADEYYFVLPDFNGNAKGYDANDKAASNFKDFNIHTNIRGYKHFYVPPKTMDDYPHYVVVLTKDNKELPFEKITIGEFFTQAEKQLPVWQKITDVSAQNLAKAQKNLTRLKEKYKSKWNNIAELELSTQIDIWSFINATEGYNDFFDNKDIYGKEGIHTSFPILRVSKAAKELCKTDQPQWLVVRWTMGMPTKAFNIHLHESILNNFNFEYLYNYFYDPEKVKGIPYKPLRSPKTEEKLVVTEKSTDAKKMEADASVFYFEDFSTTPAGQRPNGWKSEMNSEAKPATVVNVRGRQEKWLEIKGQSFVSPQNIKLPLPQNFEISFDLAVPKDIAWGAKALEIYLGTKNKYDENAPSLNLRLRAGFYGRAGEGSVSGKFENGYFNTSNYFDATGFSNDKEFNNVKITLRKYGELFEFYIDKNKIVDIPKAFPATTSFNWVQFKHLNSDADNQKYFISNIKIIKL